MFGRSNSIKSTPPTTTPRPADNGSNGNNAPSGTLGGARVTQAQTANTPAPKPSGDWKTTPMNEATRQNLSAAFSTIQARGNWSKSTNNDNAGQVSAVQIGANRTNNDDIRQTNYATRQDPSRSVSGTHTDDGQSSVSGEEKRKGWRASLKLSNVLKRGDTKFQNMDNQQLAREARVPTFGPANFKRIQRAEAEVDRRLEMHKTSVTDTVKALLETVKKVSIEGNIDDLLGDCLSVSEQIDGYRETLSKLKDNVDWDGSLKECLISNELNDSELEKLKLASTKLKAVGNDFANNADSLPTVMVSNGKNYTKAGNILEIIYKAMEQ